MRGKTIRRCEYSITPSRSDNTGIFSSSSATLCERGMKPMLRGFSVNTTKCLPQSSSHLMHSSNLGMFAPISSIILPREPVPQISKPTEHRPKTGRVKGLDSGYRHLEEKTGHPVFYLLLTLSQWIMKIPPTELTNQHKARISFVRSGGGRRQGHVTPQHCLYS